MSAIIAFCERHGQMSMLNLLRSVGPMTTTTEILALNVLEEIAEGKPELTEAIRDIKTELHPVERAKRFRATIIVDQEAQIAAREAEIMALTAQIENMRMELTKEGEAKKRNANKKRPHETAQVQEFDRQMPEEEQIAGTQPDQAENLEGIALTGRA